MGVFLASDQVGTRNHLFHAAPQTRALNLAFLRVVALCEQCVFDSHLIGLEVEAFPSVGTDLRQPLTVREP